MKEQGVSPYTITFFLALILGFSIVFFCLKKRGVPSRYIRYSILLDMIMTLSGAMMFSIIASGFKRNIFNVGMSSLGGVIGLLTSVLIFNLIYSKHKKAFFEVHVLVIPLMYSVAKIGCYIMGCCHGIPYAGPFSVTYQNYIFSGGPYFPVQLVESIVFGIIFCVGVKLYVLKLKNFAPIILVLCSTAKFLLDYLREEHIGKILSINQFVCAAFCVLGILQIIRKCRTRLKEQND